MVRRFFTFGLVLISGVAVGQTPEETSSPPLKALTLKQEMVRDRFERFRERMFQLTEDLAKVEPENAARLARTLDLAGELGLEEELTKVAELLGHSSSLAEALDRQEKWVVDAGALMNLLLEKDSNNEERKDRIDKLKEYKQQLDDILKEQRRLRAEAARTAHAKRMLRQVEQAIQRLDALLDRQREVSKSTSRQPSGDPSARQKLSTQQQNLSREGKELAEDLKRLGELKSPDEPPSQASPPSALDKARQAAKAAGSSVKSGAESMSKAAKEVEQNRKNEASKQQQQAERKLREARKELEKARDALKKESQASKSAPAQRKTAQNTKQLRDKLKSGGSQSPSGSSGKSGKQGQKSQKGSKGQQGKSGSKGSKGKKGDKGKKGRQGESEKPEEPMPGSENLDRAGQKMDDAADKLEGEKPDDATQSQDEAIEELEEAQREIEDVLMQLRHEERAEMLRDLEDRFRDLLLKQRAINDKTVELDEVGRDKFGRAEKLKLADLGAAQRQLAAKAATCGHILDEEGTTIAFPRVVGQIAEDMGVVAGRLGRTFVGSLTQRIQEEIVSTLEQLLDALKKMQQDNEQGGQKGGKSGKSGDDPLLPTSAELKLLRSSQARVNVRTTVIEEARLDESEPPAELDKAFKQAAGRQNECREIAEEMRDQATE